VQSAGDEPQRDAHDDRNCAPQNQRLVADMELPRNEVRDNNRNKPLAISVNLGRRKFCEWLINIPTVPRQWQRPKASGPNPG
jgi:hypothetical protein